MARQQRRVKRTRQGDFQLRLSPEEREVLRALPEQLRELLHTDDPALARLFPPAYRDDPERNEEYERLMRSDLQADRLASLQMMESTIDASRISEEQLVAWLGVLNDLRLTLGTKLDVTEDLFPDGVPPDHPHAHIYALYFYLGWLQEQVVEELASSLPGPNPEEAVSSP